MVEYGLVVVLQQLELAQQDTGFVLLAPAQTGLSQVVVGLLAVRILADGALQEEDGLLQIALLAEQDTQAGAQDRAGRVGGQPPLEGFPGFPGPLLGQMDLGDQLVRVAAVRGLPHHLAQLL